MADLTRLTQEVSEIKTASQSAIVLLNQLSQLLRENATDPQAINDLADQLDSEGTALGEAVAANTPST